MNVDEIFTDWGTAVRRAIGKQPLDKGGWSMFASFAGGYDNATPITHARLRGNGPRAGNGWPVAPVLETLRDAWMETEDSEMRYDISRKIQAQAMVDVPYLPLGSYFQPVAYRADLTDMKKGLIQFTGVRRAA